MKLVVDHAAAWVAVDGHDANAEKLTRLDEVCAANGREPRSLRRMALLGFSETPLASLEALRDCVGRYAEMGFTDAIVHWPRADAPFAGGEEILDQIAGALSRGELG